MTPEERLKGSFLLFLMYVWTRVLKLPKPTRVQLDIAQFLEHGPRKRFIAAFRGVGKTFLTGAYIVWRLWKEPDLKIMVVSANERFAGKVAAFVHGLINAEDVFTREPVPWAELKAGRGQKDSTMEFDVGPSSLSKDPSVFAVGIGGQMTGGRADLILSDDVEVPTNSATETEREKLEDRTGEYAAIAKPETGEVIYLGTFQSMASIYRGLREKGYTMRLWPARYPLKDKMPLYEETMAPMLLADIERDPTVQTPQASSLGGAPTDPARFTDMVLMEKETEWKQAGFQLQFMLDTSLTDQNRYPLKTKDLIVMDVPPEVAPMKVAWGASPDTVIRDFANIGFDGDRLNRPIFYSKDNFLPFTGSVMDIDPSGRGADETAYVVTKFLNGQVFVRAWGGFVDGHSEATLRNLAEIAKLHDVNLVRVEGNFGDGMFVRLLEPHLRAVGHAVPTDDHRVKGQKEVRMMGFIQPVLSSHRLVIDSTVVRLDLALAASGTTERSGLYQLTHLTTARGSLKHDDRLDVLAMALSYWNEFMNADADEALRKMEEKSAKEFELKMFDTRINPGAQRRNGRARGAGRRMR